MLRSLSLLYCIYISFAGPFRVSEALLLGITKRFWLGGWVVGWSVRSDLTHFQLEDPYQTYMVGRWYPKDYARPFFGVKGQKVKGHGVKNRVFG